MNQHPQEGPNPAPQATIQDLKHPTPPLTPPNALEARIRALEDRNRELLALIHRLLNPHQP